MKTKLLRKVRRKYRVVINDLQHEKLQIKDLIGWVDVMAYFPYMCIIVMSEMIKERELTSDEKLIALLHDKYSKYHRKSKIRQQQKNNWKLK